jgi:hypothetical protein
MKIIIVLLSLLGLMFTVGCEEEHEHHGPYGGAYDGTYGGHDHGYYYPDNGGGWHHDRD